MPLTGNPIYDYQPGLIWENNPDTPLVATSLSKSADLVVSYLDFKYNDSQNPHHREGTILMADPSTANPRKLVFKRGVVISIINQDDEYVNSNKQYRLFDSGLDDLWVDYNNKDQRSTNNVTDWGVNSQWFVFIGDNRINNIETGQNTAQIIVSQSPIAPEDTQIPESPGKFFSQKDTRLIGGFKVNSSGNIIINSVWDISGKYHTVKAKKYMILDEYSTSDSGKHIYRPLKFTDLDGVDQTDIFNGDIDINGNLDITGNVSISGNIESSGIEITGLSLKDNSDNNYSFKNSNVLSDSGIALQAGVNPSSGNSLFTVMSSDQSQRLRVEHDGEIYTSNNTVNINGVTITRGNNDPSGTTPLGIDGYFYATKVHNAVYNDLAEFFLSDSPKLPGQVYVISESNKIKLSNKRADKKVVGVCSDQYAFAMKTEYENKGGVPIALSGTIPVLVKSKVKRGDELVSYKDGIAIKANWFERVFKRSTIIGKALQDNLSDIGQILILVRG